MSLRILHLREIIMTMRALIEMKQKPLLQMRHNFKEIWKNQFDAIKDLTGVESCSASSQISALVWDCAPRMVATEPCAMQSMWIIPLPVAWVKENLFFIILYSKIKRMVPTTSPVIVYSAKTLIITLALSPVSVNVNVKFIAYTFICTSIVAVVKSIPACVLWQCNVHLF